jgi:hypothetical protein
MSWLCNTSPPWLVLGETSIIFNSKSFPKS